MMDELVSIGRRHDRRTAPERDHLVALLRNVCKSAPPSTTSEARALARLDEFAGRLQADRFQLAFVGQFKRGKSSLLNALLQINFLPTGVVPLTAIPTFIAYGERLSLRTRYDDRDDDLLESADETVMRARLAELVTEAGNPHNEKHVTKVELRLAANLLRDGLVIIDTPGIGSAEQHNSVAAVAALPECDAALLVLSPDPPITDAELDYISHIQENAAILIPVVSKIDLVAGEDRAAILQYIEDVLDRRKIAHEPVFAVSARRAADPLGRDDSGIAGLERRIARLQKSERHRLLLDAIVGKTVSTLDALAFQNDAALAALELPSAELDRKMADLRSALAGITGERNVAADILAAERARVMEAVEAEAKWTRKRLGRDAVAQLDRWLLEGADRVEFSQRLSGLLTQMLEQALRSLGAAHRARSAAAAARCHSRLDPFLAQVREVVSEALGIPFRSPEPSVAAPEPPELAWALQQSETMRLLPAGIVDALLPRALRQRRFRAELLRETERLIRLNVEKIRWALLQSSETALRRMKADLDRRFAEAGSAVTEIADRVQSLRDQAGDAIHAEADMRRHWGERLRVGLAELRSGANKRDEPP